MPGSKLGDMENTGDTLSLFGTVTHRSDIPRRTDMEEILRYNHPGKKKFLYGEQGGYCLGCQHDFLIQNLSIDHIIPKLKGSARCIPEKRSAGAYARV